MTGPTRSASSPTSTTATPRTRSATSVITSTVRRLGATIALAGAVLLALAPAVAACGSLVAANGAVNLVRTTTLAAYHDGVEHYVTSFEFAGTPETFGSIIPLPGEPTVVERAGDWTLQRLRREVAPADDGGFRRFEAFAAADGVDVLRQVRIDSLDVTIVRGGGKAVARWADAQGFDLTPDTAEVLEFYARRSPYFMAARFDARAAIAAGFTGGDGIPVHLAIPTDDPWVPLRILATGKPGSERVQADVFLLTDREPTLLHGRGVSVERSAPASRDLLADLRSDRRSDWVPERAWLTYAVVDAPVRDLTYDLAVDADGRRPDPEAFGADLRLAVGSVAGDLLDRGRSGSTAWTVMAIGGSALVALGLLGALRTVDRRR